MKNITHIKNKGIFILLFLFSFGVNQTNATHIMGSDMTYRTIGPKKYEVTLNIFRDCRGVALGSSILLRYKDNSGNTISRNRPISSITNITPVCDTFTNAPCSPLNAAFNGQGAEKHSYIDTIDLNDAANAFLLLDPKFIVEWSICCRNGAITTGIGGNFYTYLEIYTNTVSNNSPFYYEMPFAILNLNRPFQRNFGGYDIDGDSLAFELVDPNSAYNTPESFTSPWTKDEPFTVFKPAGVPSPNPNLNPPVGFHLDQQTGFISFTPTLLGEVSLIVLEVREYRNGELISKSRREMQFWVNNLDNNKAHTLSAPTEICIVVGDTLKFDIVTDDSGDTLFGGTPDSVRLVWDSPVVGPQFFSDQEKFESGFIRWTPITLDARKEPYMFTFSAIDNSCPYNFRNQRTVRVYVIDKITAAPKATFDWKQNGDTSYFTNTTATKKTDVTSTEWWVNGNLASTSFDFDSILTLDSSHIVELKVTYDIKSRCGASIFIGKDSTSQLIEPKSCNASYSIAVDIDTTNPYRIFLINTSTGTGLTSTWRFSDGDSVNGTGTHNFKKFGKYEVCLEIENSTCSDTYCDSLGMDSAGNLYRMAGFTIVMLNEDDLSSIEKPKVSELSVYPNPFENTLTIENKESMVINRVEVLDLQGRELLNKEDNLTYSIQLNTVSLTSGTYLMRIHLEDGSIIYNKILKK